MPISREIFLALTLTVAPRDGALGFYWYFLGCGLGATQPLQLSFASFSPLDDKWICPLNVLLMAGLVGQSRGRVVQGDAACARKGCHVGCPSQLTAGLLLPWQALLGMTKEQSGNIKPSRKRKLH